MSDTTHTSDGQSPIDRLEQRITTLEAEVTSVKEENEDLKATLKHQQEGDLPTVSRRQTLGLLGGGALFGAAGTASAKSMSGNSPWAPDSHDHSGDYLGEDKSVSHIDTDRLHAKSLSNIGVVGPGGYNSIQAAHDNLPGDGGQIWLTTNVSETDIVFTKATKLVGAAGGLAAGRKTRIDTSGGKGLHLKSPDCTVRDVQIIGDKTGGYGLKIGVEKEYSYNHIVDNVAVHNKGGHGIVIVGSQLNNKLDINARNCAGDGWHFGPIGFFNENLIQRLGANKCDGKGLHIAEGPFVGNTINMLWCEDNADWGLSVGGDVVFQGNQITGYGIETKTADVDERCVNMSPLKGDGGNILQVASIKQGRINIDETAFEVIAVGRSPATFWKTDSPVKLGQESGYFTISHDTGESTLQIRSDTVGLIGTIDKNGNASFIGDVTGNDSDLFAGLNIEKGTLTVDGDLADVSATEGLSIPDEFSVFSGTRTEGGTVWWTWDQDYLYLAANLVDDEHVQSEPVGKMWKDDAIQFGISSGVPGEADTWDGGDIAFKSGSPVVYHRTLPEKSNSGVLESAEAAITRTEGEDARAKLSVSSNSPRPYAFLSRNSAITVDLDETPYLSISVPKAVGNAHLGSVVLKDGSEQAKFFRDNKSAGTFTVNVPTETGWSGKKTFSVSMSSVVRGNPVYVDSIGFYKSSSAETAGWEDEFTSLSAWNSQPRLNAEIVPESYTRYEVALPWSELTVSPSDEFVSLSLAIHDVDTGGETGWVEWGGGILGGKSNAEFNIARLVAGNS